MSFRTNEPIEVQILSGEGEPGEHARYVAGDAYRSQWYPDEDALGKAIAQRFPGATIDGRPLVELFPALKTATPAELAPPQPVGPRVDGETAAALLNPPQPAKPKRGGKAKAKESAPEDLGELW